MLPALELNLDGHNSNQAHDAPLVYALGSNTGPQVMTPGGAHLGHNAFRSTANFVSFNSRKREIGKKSRGVIIVVTLFT